MDVPKNFFLGFNFLLIAFCIGAFVILGRQQALYDAQLKLTSWNRMQITETENYFKLLQSNALSFSDNFTVIEAYKAFFAAWNKLEAEITNEQEEQITKELEVFYNKTWLPRLKSFKQDIGDAKLYLPATKAGKWVQLHYIAKNPYPHEEKYKFKKPEGIDNDYTRAYTKYNDLLVDINITYQLEDMIFIDHKTGNEIYNVRKQVDLGQNFHTGVFKDTNQGRAFKAAAAAQNNDFTRFSDFDFYDPNFTKPAAFISTPIMEHGSKKIGIFLLQVSTSKINDITTVRGEWDSYGMGKTGESILIRQDLALISLPRVFLENAEEFYKGQAREGMPVQKIQQIKVNASPLLIYKFVATKFAKLVRGDIGIAIGTGFYSERTLVVYRPLQIRDAVWTMVSMQATDEIYSAVYKNTLLFFGYLIGLGIILLIGLTLFKMLSKNLATEETSGDIKPKE